ncbi:acyltransferase [Metapseudomonas otitidis]|jgi:acetyltransferase-like isoleucine patch superfamily enzyme|uniref:acyltransferase n=1 Tax=Metapseudomonas otitidis TaxID=319939 RepID=UPI000D1B764D|nr:acyltransferase [Pseudomonas otitidis]QZX81514.1 acyltransferase [Pseudomonas otitidis]
MSLPRSSVRVLARAFAACVPGRLPRLFSSFFAYMAWSIRARGFSAVGEGTYLRSVASIHNPQCICLGQSVVAETGLIIEAFCEFAGERYAPRITIGDRVSFGYHCHVGCIDEVSIGNDVLIASRVFIADHAHGDTNSLDSAVPPAKRRLHSKGPVRIGSGVWIGEGVVILSGVTIGDHAIIGANSVVTRDVPECTVVAGSPARLIKHMEKQTSGTL